MATFIDLFAGAGGLSEGFYQANFRPLVHVEIDKYACETLKERMRFYNYIEEIVNKSVLCGDMTDDNIVRDIEERVRYVENHYRREQGINELRENDTIENVVDIVIGGPPCQSFSTLGRARDPHGMEKDPRNFLFINYIQILEHFRPKLFVFENVVGLLSANVGGESVIDNIFKFMELSGYRVMSEPDRRSELILNSVNYGVPQNRKRVIIIGVREDLNITAEEVYNMIQKTHYDTEGNPNSDLERYVTVNEAIGDLPFLNSGEGTEVAQYTYNGLNRYTELMRNENDTTILNHVARNHNEDDKERYRLMAQFNLTFRELLENRPDLDNGRLFSNSYVVQRGDLPGRTIIAHLYKDGNQFIHPDFRQSRTFTVREAARIQSFPDNFKFIGSRTQQYKQVGNAVPPIMANKIAIAVEQALNIINNN
ncbi:MAG: DNA cytosine methyltransferase [Clostridium sp.]|uniref:DNA cytosine methyltransferase n=1 Tax=Clostridium sp. TaxID=1506 RepID=UPI002A753D55|nr:DNA cytosine methyltransferase [Clostridium sp.]MDY2631701.1 DNA cytosine methyltransferase [Clostridium sp.]MDY6228537.1 DNA cytosine methyltransferase [Clostridium sp.]